MQKYDIETNIKDIPDLYPSDNGRAYLATEVDTVIKEKDRLIGGLTRGQQWQAEKTDTIKEICICAAMRDNNGYIWRGHRHADCISLMADQGLAYSGIKNQGFVTSKNRFVTREEGLALQIDAGVQSASGEYRKNRLFSEDLY